MVNRRSSHNRRPSRVPTAMMMVANPAWAISNSGARRRRERGMRESELLQFLDHRVYALLAVDLHQPLLFGGGRHDAAQSGIVQLHAARNPERSIHEFDARNESGHALDRRPCVEAQCGI